MLIKIGNDDELGGMMGNSIIVLISNLFVRMLCSDHARLYFASE